MMADHRCLYCGDETGNLMTDAEMACVLNEWPREYRRQFCRCGAVFVLDADGDLVQSFKTTEELQEIGNPPEWTAWIDRVTERALAAGHLERQG